MKLFIITSILTVGSLFLSCKKSTNTSKETNNTLAKEVETATPSLELLWETDTIFKTSESCLYDPKHKVIYVSNVNNAPRTKDNNGFISTLSTDGKILDLKWATGMSAPKGMAYFNEVLYVTDIDAILEIDPHTGKTLRKSTLPGALMLNDLTVDKLGVVYVSAMDTNKIYSYEDGEFTLWKDNLNSPNGLLIEGNNLLVASAGGNTFKTFDIATKKELKLIASEVGRADGVVQLNSGNYVVSDWRGEIFYIKDGVKTSLYNSVDNKKLQTADIGNIPGKKTILVPTFFGNSVKAYKVNE